MKQVIWSEDYKITSYLVNLQGRAGLYPMLNLIQDVGWQHAVNLEVKMGSHLGWVFTRQKLMMDYWPKWNEEISLKTWLRPPQSESFLYRDYEVYLDSKKIGECTSTFAVMDLKTRKLAPQDWTQFPTIWNDKNNLTNEAEKIVPQEGIEDLAQFQVRNSDIDLNHHVNNTKYAQWVLDAIPMDILVNSGHLHQYQVNFLAEAKKGDVIHIHKVIQEPELFGRRVIQFQGLRASDQKNVFTAQLHVAP